MCRRSRPGLPPRGQIERPSNDPIRRFAAPAPATGIDPAMCRRSPPVLPPRGSNQESEQRTYTGLCRACARHRDLPRDVSSQPTGLAAAWVKSRVRATTLYGALFRRGRWCVDGGASGPRPVTRRCIAGQSGCRLASRARVARRAAQTTGCQTTSSGEDWFGGTNRPGSPAAISSFAGSRSECAMVRKDATQRGVVRLDEAAAGPAPVAGIGRHVALAQGGVVPRAGTRQTGGDGGGAAAVISPGSQSPALPHQALLPLPSLPPLPVQRPRAALRPQPRPGRRDRLGCLRKDAVQRGAVRPGTVPSGAGRSGGGRSGAGSIV